MSDISREVRSCKVLSLASNCKTRSRAWSVGTEVKRLTTSKDTITHSLHNRISSHITDRTERQIARMEVRQTLRTNGYSGKFTYPPKPRSQRELPTFTKFTSLPYIQGTTEKIRRILSEVGVKVAMKPIRTIGQYLSSPIRILSPRMKSYLPEVESRTQGSRPGPRTQKNPRPRPRTVFPRTDTLEAKDRNARGQGPRTQAQVLSKKKKKKKGLHKNFSGDLQKAKVFTKIFQAISTRHVARIWKKGGLF